MQILVVMNSRKIFLLCVWETRSYIINVRVKRKQKLEFTVGLRNVSEKFGNIRDSSFPVIVLWAGNDVL